VKLTAIIQQLDLRVMSGGNNLDIEVSGGYVGDLLSDVIANSCQGQVWITRQVHQNIVAVATLKDLAGIIIIGGNVPAAETQKKAEEERVPILVSSLSCFETAGRIHRLISLRS
jgi:predicted transcriptional regulator